jgi:hypothetical protein
MESLGPDELEFIVDLLNVAPLELADFVKRHLRDKLMRGELVFLATAVSFLENSQASDVLVRVVSERLGDIPIDKPLGLGLLLYVIEHRLVLMDAAVKYGLVPPVALPRFSPEPPAVCPGRFLADLAEVLKSRVSVPIVALPLRILERLCKEPPPVVLDVRDRLIADLVAMPPNAVMEAVLGHPEVRCRCDLQFLLRGQDAEPPQTDAQRAVQQLGEVLAAIGRWTGFHFQAFAPQDLPEPGTPQTFTTANQQTLTLAGSNLLIGEVESLPLARVYFGGRKEKRTIFAILVPLPLGNRRTIAQPPEKGEERRFDFLSAAAAGAFVGEVEKVQRRIVGDMLKLAVDLTLGKEGGG